MEMCYDGTLVMPSSYAVMSEEEMTYVEGGGNEWIVGIACSLIANAIWALGRKCITSGMVEIALLKCAGAAKAVWAGIKTAAAFVWNTPVALAIVSGVIGIAVGVVCTYYLCK